jgi:L-alanine-DL-glutamate epimerase-like enolase superfamily enzyme
MIKLLNFLGSKMAKIQQIQLQLVNLDPKVKRTDAIQSFVTQETPIVSIIDEDGQTGIGYTYTIGTGGSSVFYLLKDHLLPQLIGTDAEDIESIWKGLHFHTHATAVGAITSLALAAIDTALWDLRCKRAGLPLWKLAGGAKPEIPVYSTEGGWLHIPTANLVQDALGRKAEGFGGCKVKVGSAHVAEDVERLQAVREAVGPTFEIMTDANQAFTQDEAIRRARHFEPIDIAWFEEPLPAEDLGGHIELNRSTSIPIAVGESMYHPAHFREYMQRGACNIIQVDVARIGGITPWLKTAHTAETFHLPVCPHFLMELHVSLCCAVPNSRWLEYIPQLDDLTNSRLQIIDGMAQAPNTPGIGIEWDLEKVRGLSKLNFQI